MKNFLICALFALPCFASDKVDVRLHFRTTDNAPLQDTQLGMSYVLTNASAAPKCSLIITSTNIAIVDNAGSSVFTSWSGADTMPTNFFQLVFFTNAVSPPTGLAVSK